MKSLSCAQAQRAIADEVDTEGRLEAHLEACADCRAERKRQQAVRSRLTDKASWPEPSRAYQRFLDRHQRQTREGAQPAGMPREPGVMSDVPDAEADDTIGQYLREIGNIPLLSADQEKELGQAIAEGIEALETLENPARLFEMDDAEIEDLRQQVDAGDLARRQLTRANGRLVVHIAKKYTNRGVPFQDLIQEGNLGLMRAVEKFDYTKGFKFSTYATWWIRQAVTRALADQARTIRVPVHMAERIAKVAAVGRELEQEMGRDATPAEIGKVLDFTAEEVERVLQIARHPISLERPTGEDAEASFGDFIADDSAPDPGERAATEMLRSEIAEVLSSMLPREAEVLALRYGLADGQVHTLEEVGDRFGVTRERIRQIETKALRRLRHPSRSNRLRDFLR